MLTFHHNGHLAAYINFPCFTLFLVNLIHLWRFLPQPPPPTLHRVYGSCSACSSRAQLKRHVEWSVGQSLQQPCSPSTGHNLTLADFACWSNLSLKRYLTRPDVLRVILNDADISSNVLQIDIEASNWYFYIIKKWPLIRQKRSWFYHLFDNSVKSFFQTFNCSFPSCGFSSNLSSPNLIYGSLT